MEHQHVQTGDTQLPHLSDAADSVPPDVDLPDAAFHGGTAPVVVHAHATGAPVAIDIVTPLHAPDSEYGLSLQHRQDRLDPPHMSPNFRPILLRSIRC